MTSARSELRKFRSERRGERSYDHCLNRPYMSIINNWERDTPELDLTRFHNIEIAVHSLGCEGGL